MNLIAVFLASIFVASARADNVADVCHRASPKLECAFLKFQSGLNAYALAKAGKYIYNKDMNIRYGVMTPNTAVLGDVLFIHGFADRLDNHVPLFEEFNRRGFRVISFDLPGHGENTGYGNEISNWTFSEIANLAGMIETKVVKDSGIRPEKLLVAGWSTGGLIALRMGQGLSQRSLNTQLNRDISGLILYAPGVYIRAPWSVGDFSTGFAWGMVGVVTQESLTHHQNPPHNGPISPKASVLHPVFGMNLLYNAFKARALGIPSDFPTLVFVGDNQEDLYADSESLRSWTWAHYLAKKPVTLVDCRGGRHELDNEAEPMGDTVRKISGEFASRALTENALLPMATEACSF